VQRLAVHAEIVFEEFAFAPQPSTMWGGSRELNVTLWTKLNAWYPDLNELFVVFGGGLNKDCVVDDLIEIGRRRIPVETWCQRWDVPNFRIKSFRAKSLPCVKQLEVAFVRTRS
jgi:hypothetical protein